jgi:GntR family transcriptional regulator
VRLTAPFHELMASVSGLKLRLIDEQRVRGPSGILSLLGIPAGEEMLRIRRSRHQGKRPVSYEVLYLSPRLADALEPKDLKESLLADVLEAKAGVFFQAANQTIEASLADDEAATALGVPVGSPLLLVQRSYELDTGGVEFVAVNRYPGHVFRYEIRLVRQDAGRQSWQITPEQNGAFAEIH